MKKKIWILLTAVILAACKSIEYIPVESESAYYDNRKKEVSDVIKEKDSEFIYVKGDSVIVEKWRTVDRVRKETDTIYIDKEEKVEVPYPVERKLSKWEELKMEAGGILLPVCAAMIAIVIVRWLRKRCGKR